MMQIEQDALNLDEIDRKIIAELQGDGRMTNVELAKRAGISPPPRIMWHSRTSGQPATRDSKLSRTACFWLSSPAITKNAICQPSLWPSVWA